MPTMSSVVYDNRVPLFFTIFIIGDKCDVNNTLIIKGRFHFQAESRANRNRLEERCSGSELLKMI